MSPRAPHPHDAWSDALDELEALVAEADAALPTGDSDTAAVAEPTRPWTPPVGLGPLPPELANRASSLADRQRDVIGRVEEARSAVLRHLGAVRSVEASHEPSRPVYLDATG